MTFTTKKTTKSVPITPISTKKYKKWLQKQPKEVKSWLSVQGFEGCEGQIVQLQNAKGDLAQVIFGVGSDESLYTYAHLPAKLPATHTYYVDAALKATRADEAAIGWALGCYAYTVYKSAKAKKFPSLVWPENANKKAVYSTVGAISLTRDLINTPPNNMQPKDLEAATKKLGTQHKAKVSVIKGKALLEKNYPTIYTVGQAGEQDPRLIDLRWGNAKHPKVSLVGKGVCFDTGGLNIKTGNYMSLMKKDMGGAAHVLGLAHMIMMAKLPVRLRVLIPAVENSISDEAFRPSDVIKTRKGITVEIDNTDAEGRLIMCDALADASDEKPELLMDFATLTGAARIALGPELAPVFTNDNKVMKMIEDGAKKVQDPVWRMPLWAPYISMLDSHVADIKNSGSGFAGAITAALYLEQFVGDGIPWVHIDTYGWNPSPRPGRPVGGEAYGLRASFEMIKTMFGKKK